LIIVEVCDEDGVKDIGAEGREGSKAVAGRVVTVMEIFEETLAAYWELA